MVLIVDVLCVGVCRLLTVCGVSVCDVCYMVRVWCLVFDVCCLVCCWLVIVFVVGCVLLFCVGCVSVVFGDRCLRVGCVCCMFVVCVLYACCLLRVGCCLMNIVC